RTAGSVAADADAAVGAATFIARLSVAGQPCATSFGIAQEAVRALALFITRLALGERELAAGAVARDAGEAFGAGRGALGARLPCHRQRRAIAVAAILACLAVGGARTAAVHPDGVADAGEDQDGEGNGGGDDEALPPRGSRGRRWRRGFGAS